ncbi:hypothetical protein VNO78_17242 [Psophocarpus tetragonolobus]|uniref:Dirigent protein n=1 Tax=Psophocarpus tetragonolobus TaxID=3891 RepID=A0AAN9SMJ8_PSOTE
MGFIDFCPANFLKLTLTRSRVLPADLSCMLRELKHISVVSGSQKGEAGPPSVLHARHYERAKAHHSENRPGPDDKQLLVIFRAPDMADDPLTVGPERDSKEVGRGQGMFGFADENELGLVMLLNFAFTEGKYNGSGLSMVGRNMVLTALREMPIVGGSGLFRFARGYAQANTHTLDINTGDAVVEFNIYVFHY